MIYRKTLNISYWLCPLLEIAFGIKELPLYFSCTHNQWLAMGYKELGPVPQLRLLRKASPAPALPIDGLR